MLSVGLLAAWLWGVRINLTPSMPMGIYLISETLPQKGDLAFFCLPSESEWAGLARERAYLRPGTCSTDLQPLLKRVAAIEGDSLELGAQGIMINGQTYPHSDIRTTDSRGRSMPSVLAKGPVPPGCALLLGDSPSSFDSRYFGPVPQQHLRRVTVIQLFNREK